MKKKITFTTVGGLLLALCIFLTRLPDIGVIVGFTLAPAIVIIIVGLINRRYLYIITLLAGLFYTAIGIYGIYEVVKDFKTTPWRDTLMAYLCFVSGCCITIGAVQRLFKRKPIRIEFDFESK